MNDLPAFQRHSDTSREAAIEVYWDVSRLQQAVLDCLRGWGDIGGTDEEIQTFLAMNPSTQRPRRIELVRKGLVVDSGMRRKTKAKKPATVWVACARP